MERFIQTLQQEYLDYCIVFGKQHMDHLVSEVVAQYHEQRPQQAKENDPLAPTTPAPMSKNRRGEADRTAARHRAGVASWYAPPLR